MSEFKVDSELTKATILSTDNAASLLYEEAACLDHRKWDDWLEMFTEDATFWMPAWKSEDQPTDDPNREVSLIYYEGRVRLRERVWRAQSGQSPASVPLARTVHSITNVIIVHGPRPEVTDVRSTWTVHQYNPKRKNQDVFFGFYEHKLRWIGDAWRIARKKIILLNDHIPAVLDFYSV
jgi:3-phenylpropionate/cinnamic acid dioxygenase small subunit